MTDFNTYFHSLALAKNVSRADILARCIIKAIRAKSDDKLGIAQALVNKAFTPPSNNSKVANGALLWWGYHHARCEMGRSVRASGYLAFMPEDEQALFLNIMRNLKAPN